MTKIVKSKPVAGWCKSHALYLKQGSAMTPLCYFRKPKHISDADFELLLDDLEIWCSNRVTTILAKGNPV